MTKWLSGDTIKIRTIILLTVLWTNDYIFHKPNESLIKIKLSCFKNS